MYSADVQRSHVRFMYSKRRAHTGLDQFVQDKSLWGEYKSWRKDTRNSFAAFLESIETILMIMNNNTQKLHRGTAFLRNNPQQTEAFSKSIRQHTNTENSAIPYDNTPILRIQQSYTTIHHYREDIWHSYAIQGHLEVSCRDDVRLFWFLVTLCRIGVCLFWFLRCVVQE